MLKQLQPLVALLAVVTSTISWVDRSRGTPETTKAKKINGIHIVRKSEASLPWSWFHCWVKLAKMHPSPGLAHLKAGSTFSAGAPSHVTEVLWQDWSWRLDASLAWHYRGREEQAVEWVPTWYRKLDFAEVTHADLAVMPWYTQLCFTREGTEV